MGGDEVAVKLFCSIITELLIILLSVYGPYKRLLSTITQIMSKCDVLTNCWIKMNFVLQVQIKPRILKPSKFWNLLISLI